MPADDAFYLPDGEAPGGAERFTATERTRGPWDEGSQHAGPVAALIGRALERCAPREGTRIGRITFEILGPVPIGPVRTRAEVERPGRKVEMLSAELAGERGPLVRARAWRIRAEAVPGLPPAPRGVEPPPGPETAETWEPNLPGIRHTGWHTSVEWRFVRGAFEAPGPATGWMRMRHPLVAGEETSPLSRLLCAADAGNGISAELDWTRFLFVNTDLTVHLHRHPAGEWVALDAVTRVEPDGVGMAESLLHDERGPLGRAAQTLFVAAR